MLQTLSPTMEPSLRATPASTPSVSEMNPDQAGSLSNNHSGFDYDPRFLPANQLGMPDSWFEGLAPEEPSMTAGINNQVEVTKPSFTSPILPCCSVASVAGTAVDSSDDDTSAISFDVQDEERVRIESDRASREGRRRRWWALRRVRSLHLKRLQLFRLNLFFNRRV